METNKVTIAEHVIGIGQPCFLIAEVGTTCLGHVEKAISLVKAAAAAGMNAVKFQVIDPEQLSDKSVTYAMQIDGELKHVNMFEMFKTLVFKESDWKRIVDICNREKILFFATVDSLEGVDLLERLGVVVHKIGAWDVTYRQLIEKIAKTKKPIFVDLGPATGSEIDDLVGWYRDAGGESVLFMHDFHTQDAAQMNLRAITYLNQKFPWPAGFSSPARNESLDIAALTLGAAYIEKRLVLEDSERAFHAHESLTPTELKVWMESIRQVEAALGSATIEPSTADLIGKTKYYKSLCTLQDVREGDIFGPSNLGVKRPGTGIPASNLRSFFGKYAKRSINANTLITQADAE